MVKRQETNADSARRMHLRRSGLILNEIASAIKLPRKILLPGILTTLLLLAGCAPKTPQPGPTQIPPTAIPSPTPTAEVTAPSPTPEPCLDASEQVEKGTFTNDFLPEYYIYFPKCYFVDEPTRYPVLYLLHGQTYTAEQWLDLGVPEQAAALMDAGEIPPFIIVMPLDRLSWDLVENDPFGDVFIDEFIDHIDAEYRTLPEREYRALGGLSRGAGWTIRKGLQNWALFGALGIHSPAIFQRDASKLDDWLRAIPAEEMPSIFFDIGDRDTGLADALRFADLLAQMGIVHEWHLYTGWHDDVYWQAHVEEYLRWYGAFFDMGD